MILLPGLYAISQSGHWFPVKIQNLWNEIEEIFVVLGNSRTYSTGYRSYELLKTCVMFSFSSLMEHIRSLDVLTDYRLVLLAICIFTIL